ncbi:MAG: ATP synthase F0 subunit B [Flavobacteriaceae bacterium]|nr:MAG: ATP synthase F0 subunit B [Flavobacteriaceae bacterium]
MEKLMNDFSLGLFVYMGLIFIFLVLLLKKLAWKPILDAVNEREEGIRGALAAAENAKKELENLNADNERILKEARAERDLLLKDARDMKDNIISAAKAEAKEQQNLVIEQAKAAIASEKQAAIADIRKQVATLSIDIAEKVIRKELSTDKKQAELVSDMLKEVNI